MAGPTPGTDHDFIHADRVSLGGELAIELLDGFHARLGESFVIVTFESRLGEFGSLVGREVDGESVFSVV